jgi:PKD repeat protein
MMASERGQSEVVGVVLLTAVIVLVVSVAGLFILSNTTTDAPPRISFDADATTQNITVYHAGGETIPEEELDIILRGASRERYAFSTFTQSIGSDATVFEAGDEWYRSHGIDGEEVEVLIVHRPSNEVIARQEIDIQASLAARIDYTPSKPTTLDTVSFDGSDSVAVDGTINSYEWEFGDRTTATGKTATHSYDDAGSYDVNLTVRTGDGQTATRTRTIEVDNPSPTAAFTYDPLASDRTIEFDASASAPGEPGGTIENYSWDFADGTTERTTAAVTDHTFSSEGSYRVKLTVVDNNGETATTSKLVGVFSYFTVSDLTAPGTAQQGEQITVNATVENTGTETATQMIEYRFNGSAQQSTQLELGYQENTTVSFDYTVPADQATGTYTHGIYSENESRTADIEVTDASQPPAESNLTNLDIAEQGDNATVTEGDVGDVSVDVENVGGQEGDFDVTLTATDSSGTDDVTRTQTVTVGAGNTSTVTFTDPISGLTVDDYNVTLSTADSTTSGTLTVEKEEGEIISIGGTVSTSGSSGDYEFELENTGNIDATLVAIGINETSNDNAVRVYKNNGKILTKDGTTIIDETIEFDSNSNQATRYDLIQNVTIASGDTGTFEFDRFEELSNNGYQKTDMSEKTVTITVWFSDGSQTTLTLDPNA